MSLGRITWVCGAMCILGLTVPNVATAQQLRILGSLFPEDNDQALSSALGISADGKTVVGSSTSFVEGAGTVFQAFRWTVQEGMVGLGFLPGDYLESSAVGVSSDGRVIAGTNRGLGGNEPFRWTAETGMVSLGHLPNHTWSGAHGVSADGEVIVGFSQPASGVVQAFRWTSEQGMQGLGFLNDEYPDSLAQGVSADGSVVVGGAQVSKTSWEAFRWTAHEGMIGLGDLPGGIFSSAAEAVSADGTVIVGSSVSLNGNEAFRWTADSGMIGLGDLAGGTFSSSALGLSADGSVVVGSSRSALGSEAFIWTAEDGMRSVQDVLLSAGVDLDGWHLSVARAVSADGRVIVGDAWRMLDNDRIDRAWIADLRPVPEPGSLWLMAIAMIAVGASAWRRRARRE